MPKAEWSGNTISSPRWAGDFGGREHIMPFPARLDAAQFNKTDAVVVVVGAAGAAIGATSIPVDALSGAIPSGTFLNFGAYAPVIVTVSDADVNAGETTIGVAALSGPIPAGTRLEFSGAGAGYAQLTANAEAGATSLTVEALPEDIDNGATATFAGGTKQARLTANAAAGATALTVDELQFPLVDDETATYAGTGTTKKTVPSGTPVGRTYAERDASDGFGPADTDDDEFFLTYFDVYDADDNPDVELYRPGSLVKENYLPNWSSLATLMKTKIRTVYQCILGTD